MFTVIAKTAINWKQYLQILPTEIIQEFDRKQIQFDNVGTFLKTLKAMSGVKALDVAFTHVHYSFGFKLEMETAYTLNMYLNGKIISQWDEDFEKGVITANLLEWRNFIVAISDNRTDSQLLKIANDLYSYFINEKLEILFEDYRRVQVDSTTFILV